MSNEQFPSRRTPAKGVHIFPGGPNWVFLTVNAKERVLFRSKTGTQQRVPSGNTGKPIIRGPGWLAQDSIQKALHGIWLNTATAWLVTDYLLMPDHLHLFCAPRDLQFTMERWIAFWKDCLAKMQPEAGAFQRGGFHHRLRRRESYSQKWQYVRENPLRAGLVNDPEDWPYQGKVHDIRWD